MVYKEGYEKPEFLVELFPKWETYTPFPRYFPKCAFCILEDSLIR